MADWNAPTSIATAYALFLTNLKDRDVDAITLQKAAPTNLPDGAIKWNRGLNKFQEWNNAGGIFVDMVIDLAGGGTGAVTAAAARTSLGLGTMAVQNDSAVNITGGTIIANGAGITSIAAGNIATGTIATARLGAGAASSSTFLRGDQTWASIPSALLSVAALQSADFTAAIDTVYPLTGTHVVTLPTVVANAGRRVVLVNRSTGVWTVNTNNGSETILGATSYSFNWGQYSAIVLHADANSSVWDII